MSSHHNGSPDRCCLPTAWDWYCTGDNAHLYDEPLPEQVIQVAARTGVDPHPLWDELAADGWEMHNDGLTAEAERRARRPAPITAYVSIGNSDGKLSHAEWAEFYSQARELLTEIGVTSQVFGAWHSFPASPYVNACWAVEIPAAHVDAVKSALRALARRFRQDTIAFAVAETELLAGGAA